MILSENAHSLNSGNAQACQIETTGKKTPKRKTLQLRINVCIRILILPKKKCTTDIVLQYVGTESHTNNQ